MHLGAIAITGGRKLGGEVAVQGSKNSVLPMIAAALLCKDITTIYNCPQISDVHDMVKIVTDIGGRVKWFGHTLVLDTRSIITTQLDPELTCRLRASIIFMGAMIGREKKVTIGYPGGCNIGKRPIDFHIRAFEKMNVKVDVDETVIKCHCEEIKGAVIPLDFPSVGATENILLLGVVAKGVTIIKNAAKEPEIVDLVEFLVRMGAKITGVGTDTITITGVSKLVGCKYFLKYDRIVAGTYLLAAVCTRSCITLTGIDSPDRMENIMKVIRDMGSEVTYKKSKIVIDGTKRVRAMNILTAPYPGTPTDIQSMLLTALTTANGKSQMIECIFEGRFATANQLIKMGAIISIDEQSATIFGVDQLSSGTVEATDLRGGASLILAGLMAEGETIVLKSEFMERGYERFVENLKLLGAQISYRE